MEIGRGTLTRVAADGRVQVVADMGGGPNGAAIGPDGAVYICNNGGFHFQTEADGSFRPVLQAKDYSGGRIERVNLATGRFERLFESVEGHRLRGPNDLVFDVHGGFYFTDLGKVREDEADRGGIYYAGAGAAPSPLPGRWSRPTASAFRPMAGRLLRRNRRRAPVGVRRAGRRPRCEAALAVAQRGEARRRFAGGHYQRFDSLPSTPSATSASPP